MNEVNFDDLESEDRLCPSAGEMRGIGKNGEDLTVYLKEREIKEILLGRANLCSVLKSESVFSTLWESYRKFKSEIAYQMVEPIGSSFFKVDYRYNFDVRAKLNSVAFNVLNLGKLYYELMWHEVFEKRKKVGVSSVLKDLLDENQGLDNINTFRKQLVSEDVYFKLALKLRNYAQHDMLPVSTIVRGMSNSLQPGDDKRTVRFSIPIDSSSLRGNKNFSNGFLDQFSDKIDLHVVIDHFVYGLSRLHQESRRLSEEVYKKSKSDLCSKLELFKDGSSPYVIDGDGKTCFYIVMSWLEHIDELRNTNRYSINFAEVSLSGYAKVET